MGVRLKCGYGCGTERICGTERNGYEDKMRNGYGDKMRNGTDMGIKCGMDMGI